MKIRQIIDQMTLEEKASLCSGSNGWESKGVERLQVPSVRVSDGPHGLRKQVEGTDNLGMMESMQVAKDATRMILYGMGIMTAMYLHRVAIQALHHPEFSAIAGVCQLIARVVTIAIGSSVIGKTAYFITDCAAWLVSLPIVAIPCYILLHKMIKEESAGRVGKHPV